jgi:hypothetical protein
MSSSLLGSWIDLDAATDTARKLCLPQPPAPPARPSSPEADEDRPTPEPSSTQPPPALQRRLDDIRGKAERNGLLARESRPAHPAAAHPPSAVAGTALDPFRVPCGPLTARVRALADWMYESFSPGTLFVADDQGQPLVDFPGSGDLLAAAAVLADAVQRARRHLPGELGTEVVHLPLAPDQVLSLVSSQTTLGTFQAGLTTTTPLEPEAVRLLARALKKAADPVAGPE